jgi:hypothetical protein
MASSFMRVGNDVERFETAPNVLAVDRLLPVIS